MFSVNGIELRVTCQRAVTLSLCLAPRMRLSFLTESMPEANQAPRVGAPVGPSSFAHERAPRSVFSRSGKGPRQ